MKSIDWYPSLEILNQLIYIQVYGQNLPRLTIEKENKVKYKSLFMVLIAVGPPICAYAMHGIHGTHDMHGMYGRYPMTQESSGTSWEPSSTPFEGFYKSHGNWRFMFMGFSYLVTDVQGGKRGGEKLFDSNMFMFMGQTDLSKSIIAFRTMFSIEPLTIGQCGYPLLLQTGETCDGKTPLINRQHPHDLFDELALVFTYAPTQSTSFFLYAALPGEPALGPPMYTMRYSSEFIPETPLGHHWMDSTHISFGVITGGFVYKNVKLEACVFNGREPDQYRYDIEKPKLDSYSFRVSCNPTNDLSLQMSYGFLKSAEQLEPNVQTKRITASALYNKRFGEHNNIQAAAIIGINKNSPGNTLPAFLLEATGVFRKKHMAFSRFEIINKDELFTAPFLLAEKIFTVEKITFGYIYEFVFTRHTKWGVGGLIDFPMVPKSIKPLYGNTTSFLFFLQCRLI